MKEPSFKQHKLLETVKENGGSIRTTETEDLNLHWELVRGGYLRNIVCLSGGWRFDLTDEAEQYLSTEEK